jgi:hypothetical protein
MDRERTIAAACSGSRSLSRHGAKKSPTFTGNELAPSFATFGQKDGKPQSGAD